MMKVGKKKEKTVKGYKVFEADWTCRGKQYTCPGTFEEDVEPELCKAGMHFCKDLRDCFLWYEPDPKFHIAEVIASGKIVEGFDKCCATKLKIVREISWKEASLILRNDPSDGRNVGIYNSGLYNHGNCNSGNNNSGNHNSGRYNAGKHNCGNFNIGNLNSGNHNKGHRNSGHRNIGNWNSGSMNTGKWNSGDHNRGDCNSGDWNKCNFSNGCFNTVEPKIYLFNKPSDWTFSDWRKSKAYKVLNKLIGGATVWVSYQEMTEEEKKKHPEAVTTGGYLKEQDFSGVAQFWWNTLPEIYRNYVMSIPNFDKAIFKEITGIDVDAQQTESGDIK